MGIVMRKRFRAAPVTTPALELRIHGVHGTSPESMLGTSKPDQVAGDGLTGVFRSKDPLPLRRPRPEVAVEAYSWGALTSGVKGVLGWVQRALWMLLLPFALINLAYWARLHAGEDSLKGQRGATAIRWAAVLLTMLFVLTSCVIAMDLVGWQCYRGGTKSCEVLPGVLDFMMRLAPSQRMALTSLAPLAVVGILWSLSRQSLSRYEETKDTEAPRQVKAAAPAPEQLLRQQKFWTGSVRTGRLQRLHVAAGIAVVVAYSGFQVDDLSDQRWAGWSWWAAAALLVVIFASLWGSHPADVEHPGDGTNLSPDGLWWKLDRIVLGAALLLAAADVGWLFGDPLASGGWPQTQGWYGQSSWFVGVFVALTVLNTTVFVAGRMRTVPAVVTIVLFAASAVTIAIMSTDPTRAAKGGEDGLTEFRHRLATWLDERGMASVWWGLAVAAIYFVYLYQWHRRQGKQHASHAWSGGGAAVLLGASAWVALLFTTATVTASAEYLNGPEQSVADLSSTYPAVSGYLESGFDRTIDVGDDVVLVDAVVKVRPGSDPVLLQGRIRSKAPTVEGISLPAHRDALPDSTLRSAELTLDGTEVVLIDSCLYYPTPKRDTPTLCVPESDTYAPRVVLDVPEQRIIVESEAGQVRLDAAEATQATLVIPQVLIWTPIAQLVWLAGAVLVVLLCYRQLRRRLRTALRTQVKWDARVPLDSKRAVLGKRLNAAFAHRAERIVELLGGLTVAVVLVLLVLTSSGEAPAALVERSNWGWLANIARPLATLSLYAVLGLSAGLVMLGSYFRRSESTRKAVGVIWDLTTFWPRAVHPLAPPCYAERVVPEITTRIRWALRQSGRSIVVVSGHSQGSLIAAATLIRLKDEELDRVRFITYGSQIRALYGRVFPRAFGEDVVGYRKTPRAPRFKETFPDLARHSTPAPGRPSVGSLRDRLGTEHWVNLFRRTDPLGYRVFSDADSVWDRPVPEVPDAAAGEPGPPIMTHSGYQHTPVYRQVVGGWLDEKVVPPVPGSIDEFRPLPLP
ncbi:membrane hypothetical protein [metagenome]|uniref:Integral membrane protein n=1 Tax=metagenome TaxID=256318 RepID=A0A2P2CFD2_9ZZZZ